MTMIGRSSGPSRSAASRWWRRLRDQAHRAGRDLWSRIGGFHRVLSTPSSKERFDFSGRQELYTAYIPWAVALDCADEWAAKYRTEMGTRAAGPALLRRGLRRLDTGNHVDPMLGDFCNPRLRHQLVRGDPAVVLERRRRRRLLRRRRRWRGRWWLVVTSDSQ